MIRPQRVKTKPITKLWDFLQSRRFRTFILTRSRNSSDDPDTGQFNVEGAFFVEIINTGENEVELSFASGSYTLPPKPFQFGVGAGLAFGLKSNLILPGEQFFRRDDEIEFKWLGDTGEIKFICHRMTRKKELNVYDGT